MNKNLKLLFDKIITDRDFASGMKENKSLEDLYKYCLLHVSGYTLEEFKGFLKSIILINNSIFNKVQELSDEEISNISAGANFYSPKNKFMAALMGGLLLAGCSANVATHAASALPEEGTQSSASLIEKDINFNSEISKVVSNMSEDAKQALHTVSKVAEDCLGGILDIAAPKASAQEIIAVQPTVISWPRASEVTVGSRVGQSRLSGGIANVDGKFSWLPAVENQILITPGTKTYICQFTPNDTSKYTKVTNMVSFEVKAPQMNITWPTASSIVYGQRVSDSKLNYGFANVPGHFEWDTSSSYLKPSAGVARCKVVFKPQDTMAYSPTYNYIDVNVKKSPVQMFSIPSASSITYGQSLKDSNFSSFSANVAGRMEWGNPYLKPKAGNYTANAVFVPYDSNNYEKVNVPISVIVNKQTPKLSKTYYSEKYRPNLRLGDFSLPSGWYWQDPNVRLDSAGKFSFNAVHYEDESYYKCKEQVSIEIERIDPPKPQGKNLTYDANKKLKDIDLPLGWHWQYPNEVPCVNKMYYSAYFKSDEVGSNIYEDVRNTDIRIDVKKGVPIINSHPVASSITYGQSIRDSQLSGFSANVDGKIKWEKSHLKPNAGNCTVNAIFEPYDFFNYESITIPVTVNINKLKPTLSQTHQRREYRPNLRLKNFYLPDGWHWANPDCRVDDIGKFQFEAIHDEDQNNYRNTQNVTITIDKAQPTLSLPDIVYSEATTLKDIKLPLGWHFLNEDEVPVASKASYAARFDAEEANTHFYNSQNKVDVKMKVRKAASKVEQWPELSIEYRDNIKDIPLNGRANTAGKFKLVKVPERIGENLCDARFIPDNPNYEISTGKVRINLSKNMTAENAPSLSIENINRWHKTIRFTVENKNRLKPLEFSIDNGRTWQDSPEFKNLTPSTTYNIVYRVKDTELHCASKMSAPIKMSTKKAPPSSPDKPKVKSRTDTQIVLEDNECLEFSKDNGNTWQDSCIFSNLKKSTKYQFVSRIKGDDNSMPSLPSKPAIVSTRNWFTNFIKNRL